MPKYFDENGDEITEGVFSQEEVDTQLEEAKKTAGEEAVKAAEEAATAAAAEEGNKPTAPAGEPDVAQQIQDLTNIVSGLVKSGESTGSSQFSDGLDEEKKTQFNDQFEALNKTGNYEDTPAGIEKRASDAYMLTTGEAFDHGDMNMGNLSGANAGKTAVVVNKEQSETDKGLSELLGNSEEDVKKFGGNEEQK